MNKLVTLILLFVLVAIGVYFAIHQLSIKPSSTPGTPTTTLPSFDTACMQHAGESAPRCEASKLTEVLEARAVTPQYIRYNDPDTGISFEYPSSIAKVSKEEGGAGAIHIEPIIPAYLGTEYWTGTSISIEQCDQECPDDLLPYVKAWNSRSGSDTHETITILSSNISFGGHKWVKAEIGTPIGATYVLYVTIDKEKVVSVRTDTEDFATHQPNIAKAFKRVLETVTF